MKSWTLEKTESPISNLKCRINVEQKTDSTFRGLTFHKKYIDVGQECISTSENCLRQQSNKLCTLDVERKCEIDGRRCIDC